MSRSIRSWHLLAGLTVAAVLLHPAPAAAWPCRWRADVCGPPVSGGCGITFGVGRGVTSFCTIGRGWGPCGFGFTSYRTFLYSTPGFWCSWSYPSVVAPAWNWCAPCPPFPCGLPVTCYPWSYAPIYGPVGVYPYLGLRPFQAATGLQGGGLPALALRQPVGRTVDPIRVSNVESRRRAAKLVTLGDRHLRAAVADRGRLQAALDAYRRAEAIAADQPDTILRQAIVLAALDRSADSAAAVRRAAGIDGRLVEDAPRRDAIGHLPPDPVFGDRPLGARSPLEIRGAVLLAGIFPGGNDAADGPNWIADRWSRQVQADLQVAARR